MSRISSILIMFLFQSAPPFLTILLLLVAVLALFGFLFVLSAVVNFISFNWVLCMAWRFSVDENEIQLTYLHTFTYNKTIRSCVY